MLTSKTLLFALQLCTWFTNCLGRDIPTTSTATVSPTTIGSSSTHLLPVKNKSKVNLVSSALDHRGRIEMSHSEESFSAINTNVSKDARGIHSRITESITPQLLTTIPSSISAAGNDGAEALTKDNSLSSSSFIHSMDSIPEIQTTTPQTLLVTSHSVPFTINLTQKPKKGTSSPIANDDPASKNMDEGSLQTKFSTDTIFTEQTLEKDSNNPFNPNDLFSLVMTDRPSTISYLTESFPKPNSEREKYSINPFNKKPGRGTSAITTPITLLPSGRSTTPESAAATQEITKHYLTKSSGDFIRETLKPSRVTTTKPLSDIQISDEERSISSTYSIPFTVDVGPVPNGRKPIVMNVSNIPRNFPSSTTSAFYPSPTQNLPLLKTATHKYKGFVPHSEIPVPTTPLIRRPDETGWRSAWIKPTYSSITTKKPVQSRPRKPPVHRTNIHLEITTTGKIRPSSTPDSKFTDSSGYTECPGHKMFSNNWKNGQIEVSTMKSVESAFITMKAKISTTPFTNALYPPQNDVPWDPQFHIVPTPESEEKYSDKGAKVKDPLVETPATFIEPGPVWEKAKKEWGLAWEVHVYFTGSLFALLAVYSAVSILRLTTYVRLLSRGYFISLNFMMMVMGVTRSIYLLHDSYNSNRTYPPVLAYFTFNITYPCLTSAFSVLFLSLLQATKVKLLSSKIQRPGVLMAVILFHFAFSTATDIVVGSMLNIVLLLFVCQIMFLLWSILLSLGYFYIFRKLYRSALRKQGEMIRVTFTRLHIDGADLPKRLPRPTLGLAVKVTLACAVLGVIMAGLQLYGIFSVYGYFAFNQPEPWPWWAFHFSCRLVELAMGCTMAFIATQPMRHFDNSSTGTCNSLWFPCTVFSGCNCRADSTVYSTTYLTHHSFRNPGFSSTLDSPRRWDPTIGTHQGQVNKPVVEDAPRISQSKKLVNEEHLTPSSTAHLSGPNLQTTQKDAKIQTSNDEDSSIQENSSPIVRSSTHLHESGVHQRSENGSDDGDMSVSECDSTRATAGSKVQSLCEDDFLQSSLSPFFQNGYQPRHKGMSRCSLETTTQATDVPSLTHRIFLSNSAHDFTLFKYGSTCSSESAANSFDVYIQKAVNFNPMKEEAESEKATQKIIFSSGQLVSAVDGGESSSGSHDHSIPYYDDMTTLDDPLPSSYFESLSGLSPQIDTMNCNSFIGPQEHKTSLPYVSPATSSINGLVSDLSLPFSHRSIPFTNPLSMQKASNSIPPASHKEKHFRMNCNSGSAPCSPCQPSRLYENRRCISSATSNNQLDLRVLGIHSHRTEETNPRCVPSIPTSCKHKVNVNVFAPTTSAPHSKQRDVHLVPSKTSDHPVAREECPENKGDHDAMGKSHSMNDLAGTTGFRCVVASGKKKGRLTLSRKKGSTLSLNSILHGYMPVDVQETLKPAESVALRESLSSEHIPILQSLFSERKLKSFSSPWRFRSSQSHPSYCYFSTKPLFRTSSS